MQRAGCLILLLGFAASTLQPVPLSAQEQGAVLLEQRCSGCHPSSLTKSKRKTPQQWQATVSRMVHRGARLTDEERTVLVNYLGETYKP